MRGVPVIAANPRDALRAAKNRSLVPAFGVSCSAHDDRFPAIEITYVSAIRQLVPTFVPTSWPTVSPSPASTRVFAGTPAR